MVLPLTHDNPIGTILVLYIHIYDYMYIYIYIYLFTYLYKYIYGDVKEYRAPFVMFV